MNPTAIWQWLDNNGLLKDMLAWVIGLSMGTVWTYLKLMPAFNHHLKNQRRISDLLDTKTPGGLTDVIKAIQASENPDNSMPSAPDSGPPSPLFEHHADIDNGHIDTPRVDIHIDHQKLHLESSHECHI